VYAYLSVVPRMPFVSAMRWVLDGAFSTIPSRVVTSALDLLQGV